MGQLLKANKTEQALKELQSVLSEAQIAKLNLSIQAVNKRFYHVVLVKKIHNPTKERYDVSAFVQIYNKRAYENLKTGVKSMPINKLVLLHDPSIEKDDEVVENLTSFQELQVEERVKKELEQKHKKEKDELEKKLRAEILAEMNQGDKGGNPFGDFDVEKETLPKLQKFAKDNNIDLGELKEIEPIREHIINWGREQ